MEGCDFDLSEIEIALRNLNASNAFQQKVLNYRGVAAALRRSHSRKEKFIEFQNLFGIHRGIVTDALTRFDSTLDLMNSVVINEQTIMRLQELRARGDNIWPSTLLLTADDFAIIGFIFDVLKPVRSATKELSLECSTMCDIISTLTYALHIIASISVPVSVRELKRVLVSSLSARISMLLGTKEKLPMLGGRKFTGILPTEFVIAAYLAPRYALAMHASYGYTSRSSALEIERIAKFHELEIVPNDEVEENNQEEKSCTAPSENSFQSWVEQLSSERALRS